MLDSEHLSVRDQWQVAREGGVLDWTGTPEGAGKQRYWCVGGRLPAQWGEVENEGRQGLGYREEHLY